jgi:hypothetical protein
MDHGSRLLRIGIFYDGNYFYHVSNYYCYAHPRRARLSIPGIHDFVKKMISDKEKVNERLCQIVDCHYFRGRLPAMEANQRKILLNERVFDDILMREGVVTHYLPMPRGTEKGVDVSLALEALELSIFKHFNVVVLIAGSQYSTFSLNHIRWSPWNVKMMKCKEFVLNINTKTKLKSRTDKNSNFAVSYLFK